MKNLEKTVNDRTCALRESKKRLAAEIAAHKKTLSHLKSLKAELADKSRTLLELTTLLAGLLNQNKWGPGEAETWVLLNLKELINSGVTDAVDSGPGNARPKYI